MAEEQKPPENPVASAVAVTEEELKEMVQFVTDCIAENKKEKSLFLARNHEFLKGYTYTLDVLKKGRIPPNFHEFWKKRKIAQSNIILPGVNVPM